MSENKLKRTFVGKAVSTKMEMSVVVLVDR